MSVTYSFQDGIAHIAFDDGKVNAMSREAFQDLNQAFDQVEADRAITVLSGREGIFSAGFHLGQLAESKEMGLELLRSGAAFCLRLLGFPHPVIGACTGHAYPMGAFVLLCSDYRVGVDGPFRIGMNEVRIQMTVPKFAIEVARGRLTPAWFNRAVITGELLAPAEAAQAGFLDDIVAVPQLLEQAFAKAESYRDIDMPHHHATKLRVRANWIAAIQAAMDEEL